MTKTEALYQFWSGFGMTAYPTNSVPEDTVFPWLTYEANTSYFGEQPIGCAVNLYFHTSSEAVPNAKVDEIGKAIGMGGTQIACDDGTIWIKRGSPWSISINESDTMVKRRQLNITMEFLTM